MVNSSCVLEIDTSISCAMMIPGQDPRREVHTLLQSKSRLRRHQMLYFMVLPGALFLVLFRVVPLLGSVIALQDYSPYLGIWESKWVGAKHFVALFTYRNFLRILRNTVILGLLTTLVGFPVPIILSLMLNEVRSKVYKRAIQSILYHPHFLSWVIIAGITIHILSLNGVYNQLRDVLGLEKVLLIQKEGFFRPLIVLTGIWRESGWGTIIYLAAIAGISPELYEAAIIDGANKLQRILRITIPCILPTIIIMFLLRIGSFLNLGFEHVWNFLTPLTYSVGDIIDTYVYRVGITEGRYSPTTAIGLFQSVVGFMLITMFNRASKRLDPEVGIW